MYAYRPKPPQPKPKGDIHIRVQQALDALKIKPMSLTSVVLIYDLPEETAKKLIRETNAMRSE